MQVFMQNPPTIRIGGQVSKSLYQYSMQSPDKNAALRDGAQAARRRSPSVPGLQDVTSDLEITSPQVNVDIDRDKAAALGVTASQIENAFYDAYGPRWVSTIYAPVNEYKVLLELAPRVPGGSERAVDALLQGHRARSCRSTRWRRASSRSARRRSTTTASCTAVTRVVRPRAGRVARRRADQRAARSPTATLPEGVTGQFQGAAKAFEGALSNLAVLLVIAVLVVYIVLGILYESYIHPLTILSGLPSAAFGALLTLILFHMDLNIYAFVGMIMLIGIVEKNAIMQIDFALEAERGGMSSEQAIYQGCLIRFRPIMMTTMAALLGAVPIAVGYGAGGEARQPLGLVVVGGLMFSQLVTLYLTPVFFTYMAQLQTWLGHRSAAGPGHRPDS